MSNRTSKGLPKTEVGGHRVLLSQQLATTGQTEFSFDAQQRVVADQIQLRALFGAMVRAAGGIDWLACALDREPSYASKIGDAINGVTDRKIQLEWMAPLLQDPRAFELLIGWFSERGGYAPPVQVRKVTAEEEAAAARDVLREMPPEIKDVYVKKLARKLGVRPEDVRL